MHIVCQSILLIFCRNTCLFFYFSFPFICYFILLLINPSQMETITNSITYYTQGLIAMSCHIWLFRLIALILLWIGVWSLFYPQTFHDLTSVPRQVLGLPQFVYPYYFIYEEKSGHHLMTVSIVVSVGDELITEQNQLYRVVRMDENKAYARYIRDLSLPAPSP